MPSVLLAYLNPAVTALPVPPYGMERVAHALRVAGCAVRWVAPFVERDPIAAFTAALRPTPDLVALSVRNLDDALVVRGEHGPGDIDTRGYVDDCRPLVEAAVQAVGEDRVLLGGTAIGAGGEAAVRALGARWALYGPAEDVAWRIGRALVHGEPWPDDPRLLDATTPRPRPRGFGAGYRSAPGVPARMGPYLGATLARGGRVAVQISAGCDRRCGFCVEARFLGKIVVPRPIDDVVAEVASLVRIGVRKLWLAGSELNVPDDRHAIALLRRLAPYKLDLQTFLQPAPVSDDLLDAMIDAGIDPESLSYELGHLDDRILRRGGGPTNRAAIDRLVDTYLRRGLRMLGGSVLLGAHPDETDDTVQGAIDGALAIDRALPGGLGLAYATGGRVYPETALADWVRANRDAARPHLYGADDPDFVQPVIFSKPASPRALLARVRAGLAGARGRMFPMNAEASGDEAALTAEAAIFRALWRTQEDRLDEALAELAQAGDHPDALRHEALLRANELGDRAGAVAAIDRLLTLLPEGDPRRAEAARARAALGASAE